MSDIGLLDVLPLWYDPRAEELQPWFDHQDEATRKMYYDHAESLDLYKKSGGVV